MAEVKFEYQFAYTGTNLDYVGKAAIGAITSAAVWQIFKFTNDGNGNPTDMKFASDNSAFDKIWDNRAGYTY